jgi:hypothetical protein
VTTLQVGWPGFDSWHGGTLLFAMTARPLVAPIRLAGCPKSTGLLFTEVNRLRHGGDRSPLSSAEIMNVWRWNCSPRYVCAEWCLVKHHNHIYLCLTLSCSTWLVFWWCCGRYETRGCSDDSVSHNKRKSRSVYVCWFVCHSNHIIPYRTLRSRDQHFSFAFWKSQARTSTQRLAILKKYVTIGILP